MKRHTQEDEARKPVIGKKMGTIKKEPKYFSLKQKTLCSQPRNAPAFHHRFKRRKVIMDSKALDLIRDLQVSFPHSAT